MFVKNDLLIPRFNAKVNKIRRLFFLDYDLAMRDQRMLRCLETLPRRTKIVLRNSLTKRYPAVPLPSTVTSSKTSEDNIKDSTTNNSSNHLSHDYDIDIGDNLTYLGKMLLFLCHERRNFSFRDDQK